MASRVRQGRTCYPSQSSGTTNPIPATTPNVWLKTALVTAAISGARKRGSYLADKYRRLCARRGKMRAAVAIAHKILIAVYHLLANRSDYRELGPSYLDQLNQKRTANALTSRLRAMGYDVTISSRAA